MAQQGPLLASVRRIVEERGVEELIALPTAPLPIRVWLDPEEPGLRIDLQVSVSMKDLRERERIVADLRGRGLRVTTDAGPTVVGWALAYELDELLWVDGDYLLEVAQPMRPSLDVTVPEAWNRPAAANVPGTGEGVIIGIVDTGIDVAHPDFIGPHGTRILRLWDQRIRGAAPAPAGARYGSEWDANDIDLHLNSGSVAPFVSSDPTGHGTGVAGAAAGNGRAGFRVRYAGVAEEADLVVVALEARRNAYPSTANVLNAIEYIFDLADERGQRAVVNVSSGTAIGPHDPRGPLELGIRALLDADPQRVLVVSAGNEGEAKRHAEVWPDPLPADIEIEVPDRVGPIVLADIWYDVADAFDVQIVDPGGATSRFVAAGDSDVDQVGNDMYEIDSVLNVQNVGDNNVQVKLRTPTRQGDVTAGVWTVRLHPSYVASGRPVNAWLDVGQRYHSPSFRVPQERCTITSPGFADEVVVVGAYGVSPTLGAFERSSGHAPGRCGTGVNLLAAPGAPVMTCDGGPGAGGAYARCSGTSFAAPHVTGAIALMMQADPGVTRADVISCLLTTARTDADTRAGPAEGWGAGKLDIHAALACVAPTP